MKKALFLSTLISFAVICSCKKQDSAAEAQLAQRKTELDAREEALIQREKAVAEREKAVANTRIIQSQRQAPDAAQAEAERQRRIQQLPPEIKALIPDRSQANSANVEKDRMTGDPRAGAQRPRAQQDAQRKKPMSGAKASPEAEIPEPEAT